MSKAEMKKRGFSIDFNADSLIVDTTMMILYGISSYTSGNTKNSIFASQTRHLLRIKRW